MKFQTKITLSIIPLVLLGIFVLGTWSIKKAKESIHQSTFLYMNTIMDAYVPDIERNHAYPVDPQKNFCYDEATHATE
jgi:hypothetical protein